MIFEQEKYRKHHIGARPAFTVAASDRGSFAEQEKCCTAIIAHALSLVVPMKLRNTFSFNSAEEPDDE